MAVLVHSDGVDAAEVLLLKGLLYVQTYQSPQLGVMLAHLLGDLADRHLLQHRQQNGLHQHGEAASDGVSKASSGK